MSTKTVSLEMPADFLLTIAVYGKMGEGDLPDLMKLWAQAECRRAGLTGELKTLQAERLKELKTRIENVMGVDAVKKIEQMTRQAGAAIALVEAAEKASK